MLCRGEGGGVDVGWTLVVARVLVEERGPSSVYQDAGDHKGPPRIPSSTLAPTGMMYGK